MGSDESDDEPSVLEILKSAIEAENPSQLDAIRSDPKWLAPEEFVALHTELIRIYSEKKETDALLALVDSILGQAQMAVITKGTKTYQMVGDWSLDLDATRADMVEKAMVALIGLHREAGKTPAGKDAATFGLNRIKQRLDKFWEYPVEKKWRTLSGSIRGRWERSFANVRRALDPAINEIGASQIITEKAPIPKPEASCAAKHRAHRIRT